MDKKLDLCVEPAAFFHERVSEVMTRQKFETIKVAEYYVVDLLVRYMVSANLFESVTGDESHNNSKSHSKNADPLAILFLKAQAPDVVAADKIKILRKLGDTSLYISGFFGDSLNRKIIDLEYYREMGSIAYRSLSETMRDEQFHELYQELYAKFTGFVDVLTELSQEVLIHSAQDILQLYENYVRTGSPFLKRQLNQKGLPIPPVLQNNPNKREKN